MVVGAHGAELGSDKDEREREKSRERERLINEMESGGGNKRGGNGSR